MTIFHENIVPLYPEMNINNNATGCSSCKLSSICTPKDNNETCVPRVVALKAVMWAFGLPLLLILIVLLVATAQGCSEGLTALLMLGSLVPYFLLLRLFRDKLL